MGDETPIRFQRLAEMGVKQPPMIGRFLHGQLVYVAFADRSISWTRAVDETCDKVEARVITNLLAKLIETY